MRYRQHRLIPVMSFESAAHALCYLVCHDFEPKSSARLAALWEQVHMAVGGISTIPAQRNSTSSIHSQPYWQFAQLNSVQRLRALLRSQHRARPFPAALHAALHSRRRPCALHVAFPWTLVRQFSHKMTSVARDPLDKIASFCVSFADSFFGALS